MRRPPQSCFHHLPVRFAVPRSCSEERSVCSLAHTCLRGTDLLMWVCLAGCLLLALAAADADSAGCFSLLLLPLLLLTKLRLGRAADSSGLHRDFLVSYDKLPWALWSVFDESYSKSVVHFSTIAQSENKVSDMRCLGRLLLAIVADQVLCHTYHNLSQKQFKIF